MLLRVLTVCLAVLLPVFIPVSSFSAVHRVADADGLKEALGRAQQGDAILLLDGVYALEKQWAFKIRTPEIVLRSASGNRHAVIIEGNGMYGDSQQHGISVGADDVTIADITIQQVSNHCIKLESDVKRLHVVNCVLKDAGEQILKGVKSAENAFSSIDCLVENCLFEYTQKVGPRFYIGGIDVHQGQNWIVKNNIFRFIRSPEKKVAEHAVHFWSGSQNTRVENNLIYNCDRGIGFGLGSSGHLGGVIRNNVVIHTGIAGHNDVAISLESSPHTEVIGNSVTLMGRYRKAIEYRFPKTTNVKIRGNIVNKAIAARDGASAIVEGNHFVGNVSQ